MTYFRCFFPFYLSRTLDECEKKNPSPTGPHLKIMLHAWKLYDKSDTDLGSNRVDIYCRLPHLEITHQEAHLSDAADIRKKNKMSTIKCLLHSTAVLFVTSLCYGQVPRQTSAIASHCEGSLCNLILGVKNIPKKIQTTSAPEVSKEGLLPVLVSREFVFFR